MKYSVANAAQTGDSPTANAAVWVTADPTAAIHPNM
jgi:hypothetical protein